MVGNVYKIMMQLVHDSYSRLLKVGRKALLLFLLFLLIEQLVELIFHCARQCALSPACACFGNEISFGTLAYIVCQT